MVVGLHCLRSGVWDFLARVAVYGAFFFGDVVASETRWWMGVCEVFGMVGLIYK